MPSFPKGWTVTFLENIVLFPSSDIVDGPFGSDLKTNEYTEIGVPIIRLQNIERNRFIDKNIRFIREDKAKQLERHNYTPGDIAITKLGDPVGKAAIIPDNVRRGIIVADIVRLRLDPRFIDRRFVVYAINSPDVADALNTEVKGTTRPRVNLSHIRQLPIPLAPLNEQKRIADKLDSLLVRVNACRAHLDRVPEILKSFRQAVLAAATTGKLTEHWRTQRNLNGLWESTTLGNDGLVSGGLTKNPTRSSLRLRRPYLRVANVYADRLELNDVAEIGLSEVEFEKTRLKKDDLLIVEGNGSIDQIGRAAIWSEEIPNCVHQNHIIRWSSNGRLLPRFALYWLLSPQGRASLISLSSSTSGLNTLSISKVASIPLSSPSPEEQAEIVKRVDDLFAHADRLDARFQATRARVDALTSALLAKAFRGELVPQDPTDETAAALLERIRAERAAAEKEEKTKRVTGDKPRGTRIEELMLKLSEISSTYLTDILKQRGSLTAEALWAASQLEIEDFYDQLKDEEMKGLLQEIRNPLNDLVSVLEQVRK